METMPAVELHQQPGSLVMVQLVGWVVACDLFVDVEDEEEVADGVVSMPRVSAEERMRKGEGRSIPGVAGRAVDCEKRQNRIISGGVRREDDGEGNGAILGSVGERRGSEERK